MSDKQRIKIRAGDRLYLRLSKSGKGVYITKRGIPWALMADKNKLTAVLNKEKEFVVCEFVKKSVRATCPEENNKKSWENGY